MKYIPKERWRSAAVMYFIGSLVIFFLADVRWNVLKFGLWPLGFAIFMSPLHISVATYYPSVAGTIRGAVVTAVACFVGILALEQFSSGWEAPRILETASLYLRDIATLAFFCSLLGCATVWLSNRWRRVGVAPADRSCKRCSYSLAGIAPSSGASTVRCPECGVEQTAPANKVQPA